MFFASKIILRLCIEPLALIRCGPLTLTLPLHAHSILYPTNNYELYLTYSVVLNNSHLGNVLYYNLKEQWRYLENII